MNNLKYILSGLALAGGITAQAVSPNIFAFGLASEKADAAKYNVTFKLNADAGKVIVKVYDGDAEVKSFDLGAKEKGVNTAEIDLADIDGAGLNWAVLAISSDPNAGESAVKFTGEDAILKFNEPRGIAVDNNMESPYFGRIYVSESAGSAKADGIYVMDACLEDVTGQGNTPYAGGVDWSNSSSPMRVFVAQDSKVYITDWSDGHSGVWFMDPADPTEFKSVFAAGTRTADGLLQIDGADVHGSIASCFVEGCGENTVLYTFDEDYVADNAMALLRYDIGTLENPWGAAPSAVVFKNTEKFEQNGNSVILQDGRGGWWISQDRWADAADIPSLIHIDATGTVDYNSGAEKVIASSRRGGLAINNAGTILAIGGETEVRLFSISYGETAPVLTQVDALTSLPSNASFSLAFDAADNLYLVSGGVKGEVGVCGWALPAADQFETKAASKYALEGGNSSVNALDAAEFGAAFNGGVLTVEGSEDLGTVAVFNLAGASVFQADAVGNKAEINAEGWQAGVYLVKANRQVVKVIKK